MGVIAVVGLGYVGLPLAVEFGKKVRTVGFDLSHQKVESYRRHVDPTGEVTTDELKAAHGLEVTTDPSRLGEADFIIVAVAHRKVLVDWLRTREAAARALRAELERAQQRAAKLQLIPPILLGSLEGIAETVRRDPVQTERQLTRLADYLRIALECSDERGITPERERALENALAALRQSGAYSLDFTMSA